jgi:hypothetical protein
MSYIELLRAFVQENCMSRSSRVSRLRSHVWSLTILLAGIHPLAAQEFRGSITGQVSDSSGALIPGASITAVEHSTNQTYAAKTNAAGVYSMDFLQPGEYTVTVEAPGMNKEVFPRNKPERHHESRSGKPGSHSQLAA